MVANSSFRCSCCCHCPAVASFLLPRLESRGTEVTKVADFPRNPERTPYFRKSDLPCGMPCHPHPDQQIFGCTVPHSAGQIAHQLTIPGTCLFPLEHFPSYLSCHPGQKDHSFRSVAADGEVAESSGDGLTTEEKVVVL